MNKDSFVGGELAASKETGSGFGDSLMIESVPFNEVEFKKALRKLKRLEKQNAFLIDELVKSRQITNQLKIERNVILDRFHEQMVESWDQVSEGSEDEDENFDVEGFSDGLGDEEEFNHLIHEISGFHDVTNDLKPVKKGSSSGSRSSTANPSVNTAKKRPPSSRTTLRNEIVSEDETGGNEITTLSGLSEMYKSEDEGELVDFYGGEIILGKKRKSPNSPPSNAIVKESLDQPLKVIAVPTDSEGNPQLPLSLNMITLHSLGTIVFDRPSYHNKRYIYPVGFKTTRTFLSCLDPNESAVYVSTILDNGLAPLFQVSPESRPDIIFQSPSTTGAWAAVAKQASAIRGKDTVSSASGPDFFGLAIPTVQMLIEKLPNSEKCESYAFKKYEVSNLVGGKQAKRTIQQHEGTPSKKSSLQANSQPVPLSSSQLDLGDEEITLE